MALTRLDDEDGKAVYRFEDAILLQCPYCRAPMVSPFPPTWTLQFRCDGPASDPANNIYVTPHVPDCVARRGGGE